MVVALGMTGLSSCLDDKPFFDPDESPSVIELTSSMSGSHISNVAAVVPVYADAFDISAADEAKILVTYAGAGTAPEDITVTIAVDPTALNLYNEWYKEFNDETTNEYEMLPATWYSIPSNTVVIPKGKKTAEFTINVKPDQFTFAAQFVIPLRITQVSSGVISGNFSSGLFFYQAKNELDGNYTYTTSANTSLVPNKNSTTSLQTVGRYKVQMLPGLLDTYSNLVFYSYDPVTMDVFVECPSLGVQNPTVPKGKYDPATGVMTANWKQGNGGRTFEEKFVYIGPR